MFGNEEKVEEVVEEKVEAIKEVISKIEVSREKIDEDHVLIKFEDGSEERRLV